MATLIYAYADSTAVIGPLSPTAEPHAWDLCERHAESISAPVGWDLVRVEHVQITGDAAEHGDDVDEDDLTALAAAVREAGRLTTGLVDVGEDPIEYPATKDFADPTTSNHPVHRTKRIERQVEAAKAARRAHLRVVPDPDEDSDTASGSDTDPGTGTGGQ